MKTRSASCDAEIPPDDAFCIDLPDAAALPRKIQVGGDDFILSTSSDGYNLFDASCPHQGGMCEVKADSIHCPMHGWKFDPESGNSIAHPRFGLRRIPVTEFNGKLYFNSSRSAGEALPSKAVVNGGGRAVKTVVKLHSHACIEISDDSYSLLCDPWLVGTAMEGAWINYPEPVVTPEELCPDAIWISHEHSDHFSPESLRRFDSSTPIYFPDYPNRRMEQRLRELGFTAIFPMTFGQETHLTPKISITCYECGGIYNDAIVLVNFDGYRVLNLNDAGINKRIARKVGKVDVVAAGFSSRSSGFPLTWTHFTEQEADAILASRANAVIPYLESVMSAYQADYLLPFASYFAFWHPDHQKFMARSLKVAVKLDAIKRHFDAKGIGCIDLYPGDAWKAAGGGKYERGPLDRKSFSNLDILSEYVTRRFSPGEFLRSHPTDEDFNAEDVVTYFENMNNSPEIVHSEDLVFCLLVDYASGATREFSFEVKNKRVKLVPLSERPDFTVRLPAGITKKLITNETFWDEIYIGHWCRLWRDNNRFHPGFWRLMQSPYFLNTKSLSTDPFHDHAGIERPITTGSSLTEVSAATGELGTKILLRYGLHCATCGFSSLENLEMAGLKHGLSAGELARLVDELNFVLEKNSRVEFVG